jgi:L-asparaginase II
MADAVTSREADSILATVVRSGLIESEHRGAAAVVRADGSIVVSKGDVDRVFYLRSAAKPFQATVSQELGADLVPEEMAVACGSHRGHPVHVSLVESMLAGVGLDESSLRCPPSWPASRIARNRVVAAGYRAPRRIWHNCSGKHAAMLRACVAQGWPLDSYLDPEHPLQQAIFETVAAATGSDPGPVGVDGCGAPVFRGTVRTLARAFAVLGVDSRFSVAWTAMHRYPALTGDRGETPAQIATALDAVAKEGAEGSLGVSLHDGVGLAVKAWDGSSRPLGPAAVALLRRIGRLQFAVQLEGIDRPPVLGGEVQVGEVTARENSM